MRERCLGLTEDGPGGGEYEDQWSLSSLQAGLVGTVDDGRQDVAQSLPRAGLSDTNHVLVMVRSW